MKIHNYRISVNRAGVKTAIVTLIVLAVFQLLGRAFVNYGSMDMPGATNVFGDILVYEFLGFGTAIYIVIVLYVVYYLVIGLAHVIFDIEKLD